MPTDVTASYTIEFGATGQYIDCITSNGNLTITMPPADSFKGTPMKGVQYWFVKKSRDGNTVTIQTSGNATIIIFTAPNFKCSLVSDGTNWQLYPLNAAYPNRYAGDGQIINPRFGRMGTV